MACLKAPVVSRGCQPEPSGPRFKTMEPLCETISSAAKAMASARAGIEMQSSIQSSSSKCKGLRNKKEGKFDQLWMVRWFDWYSYVKALAKKVWDASSLAGSNLLSATTRAESAKTAHAG